MKRFVLPLVAVLALLTSMMPSPAAAAKPHGVPGTAGYSASGGKAPARMAPMQGLAEESALRLLDSLEVNGGYVAAGTGMRNRGFGTITISGIPSGATVQGAYLFWDILGDTEGPTYLRGTVNGQNVVGTLIGSGGDPCWGNTANFAYWADVTWIVTGNGAYSLTNFASNLTDGRDPWTAQLNVAPMAEGATIVAVYQLTGAPVTQVVVYQGSGEDAPGTLTATLSGFVAPSHVSAQTTFIGADGQAAAEYDSTFNGMSLPSVSWDGSDPQAGPAYSEGNLWDTMTTDVSSLIQPGGSSAVATVNGYDDCHVWVGQVLSISDSSTGEAPLNPHYYPETEPWVNNGSPSFPQESQIGAIDGHADFYAPSEPGVSFSLEGAGLLRLHMWGTGTAKAFIYNDEDSANPMLEQTVAVYGDCAGRIQNIDIPVNSDEFLRRRVVIMPDTSFPPPSGRCTEQWGFDGFDWTGLPPTSSCRDDQVIDNAVTLPHVNLKIPAAFTDSKVVTQEIADTLGNATENTWIELHNLGFPLPPKINVECTCTGGGANGGGDDQNHGANHLTFGGDRLKSNFITGTHGMLYMQDVVAHETTHISQDYMATAAGVTDKPAGWAVESSAMVAADLMPWLDDNPQMWINFGGLVYSSRTYAFLTDSAYFTGWARNLFNDGGDGGHRYSKAALVEYLGDRFGTGATSELRVADFIHRLMTAKRDNFDVLYNVLGVDETRAMQAVQDFYLTAFLHDSTTSVPGYPYMFADEIYANGETSPSSPRPHAYPQLNKIPHDASGRASYSFVTATAVPGGSGGADVVDVSKPGAGSRCFRVTIASTGTGSPGNGHQVSGRFSIVETNSTFFPGNTVVRGAMPASGPVVNTVCGVTATGQFAFVMVAGSAEGTYQVTLEDMSVASIDIGASSASPVSPNSYGWLQFSLSPKTGFGEVVDGIKGSEFQFKVDGADRLASVYQTGSVYNVSMPAQGLTSGRHSLAVSVAGVSATAADAILIPSPPPGPKPLVLTPKMSPLSAGASSDGNVIAISVVEAPASAGLPLQLHLVVADARGAVQSASGSVRVTDPTGRVRTFALFDDAAHADGAEADFFFGNEVWATSQAGTFTIVTTATGKDSAGTDFSISNTDQIVLGAMVDADGDGVADLAEPRFGLDPANASDGATDIDGDGLSWAAELAAGTDPYIADTDRGGEVDGSEVAAGRDPLTATDDWRGPQAFVEATTTDGYKVSVHVGTADGTGEVLLSRVAANGTVVSLGIQPGTGATILDGPLSAGAYEYVARTVAPNGVTFGAVSSGMVTPSADVTPPDASLVMDAGAYTTTRNVAMHLANASEPLAAMRFAESPEALQAAAWQPYSQTTTFQLSDVQGPHTIYFQVQDANGLASEPLASGVTLDSVAPTSVLDPLPAYTQQPTIHLGLSAADDESGLVEVKILERHLRGTTWSTWIAVGDTLGAPLDISLAFGEGRYELKSVARDVAGNTQTSTTVRTITLVIPPSSSVSPTGRIGTNRSSISINYTATFPGGGGGSVSLWQRFTAWSGSPGAWTVVATADHSPIAFNLTSGEGTYEFFTTATDAVTGMTESAPDTADLQVVFDTIPPASSVASLPPVTSGASVWLTINRSDTGSGVASVDVWERYQTNGKKFSDWAVVATTTSASVQLTLNNGNVRYEFYTTASDYGGNVEAAPATADAWTVLDPSALPSSTAGPLPALITSISYAVPVTVVDRGTGVSGIQIWRRCMPDGTTTWSDWVARGYGTTSPVTTDFDCGDGLYEVYSVAYDAGGNPEPAPTQADAATRLDTSAPVTSVGSLPAYTNSTSLTVPFSATDAGSGLASVELWQRFKPAGGTAGSFALVATTSNYSTPFAYNMTLGDGTYDFYTIGVDAAGNHEAAPKVWCYFCLGYVPQPDATIVLDTVSPVSAVGTIPAGVATPTLNVPFTSADTNGSGIASVSLYRRFQPLGSSTWTVWTPVASGTTSPFNQTLDQGPGRYEFYTAATDKAGNIEAAPPSADAFTVYDAGPPSTHASPLAPVTTANSVSLSYTVSPGTPAASVEIWWRFQPASSGTWGSWTKLATVTSSPATVSIGATDGRAEFYTIGISVAGVRETKAQVAEAFTVRDTKAPTSAATAPAYVNATTISVPYTYSDGSGGSGVVSVDLYWRYTPPGGTAGGWSYYATTTSVGTPFTVNLTQGDGTYGFYTVATDSIAHVEAAPTSPDSSTILDRTAPSSSAGALAVAVKSQTLSVSYSAADNANGSGIASVELWCRFQPAGSTTFTSWSLVATKTSSPFSITLDKGDGRYECYTIAIDKSGNREAAAGVADDWTVLDTVTPASTPGSLPAITTATSIVIPYTVTVADPNGTAVSVQLWQRSQNPTTLVWSSWSNPTTVANGAALTANLGSDGRYEFYTIAKDAAGNIESKTQVAEIWTVRDRTAPVTTVTPLPAATTQTAQTIALSSTDNGGTGIVSLLLYGRFAASGSSTWTAWSQIASLSPSATSTVVTLGQGDGRYEYYFVGTDAAGNVESGGTYDTFTVLDHAAPSSHANSLAAAVKTTTLSVPYTATEPTNGSGTASVDLYWRFTAPGGVAGAWTYLATATASPFSVNLNLGDGRYEFYTIATDKAGNRESKPTPTVEAYTVLDMVGETSRAGAIVSLTNATSITVPYSVTAPDPFGSTVSVELWWRLQAPGSSTWSAWAKGSTVTNGAALSASLGSDGRYEFYTIAVDAAGNRESKAQAAETWTVRDRTAPVSSTSALTSPTTSTSQSLGYTATDTNGSGVASVQLQQRFQAAGSTSWSAWTTIATPASSPVSVTLASGDGRYEFRTISSDVAGNVEAAPSAADTFVVLDRTAPTSSVTAPPSTSAATSINIAYSATDKTNSAGVTSVELWTRYRANDTVGTGTWTNIATSAAASGSFTVPFGAGPGLYDVATVAVDALGNREATTVKTFVRAIGWAASTRVNSDAGSALQDNVAYAAGPDGTLYAVWEDARNGDADIYFSSRNPSTGAWTPEIKLNTDSAGASQRTPAIAVDGSGNLYVVWADDRAGSTNTDIYFVKRTGTTWGANTKVNDDAATAVQDQPKIAVTSAGMAVAVWVDKRSSQTNVYSARLAAGATAWSANYRVTSDTAAAKAAPDVTMGADGTAWAVWQDGRTNAGDIYMATLAPTGTTWSTNSRIDDDSVTTGVDRSPRIGLAASGNVLVAWIDGRTTAGQIRVRQRTGTSWSASVQVSDTAAVPASRVALAVKADGGVLVAWDDTRVTSVAVWGAQCEAGATAVTRCDAPAQWSDQAGSATRPVLVATSTAVFLGWRDDTSGGGDIRFRMRVPS